jgi:hypothetical protein
MKIYKIEIGCQTQNQCDALNGLNLTIDENHINAEIVITCCCDMSENQENQVLMLAKEELITILDNAEINTTEIEKFDIWQA